MHRGAARRTVFESRRDMRMFLAQLAKAVRRGEVEVHAYSLLNTHLHLLLLSHGLLSDAMRRIVNTFVRYFNRTRKRDGSLFRGRFTSVPVVGRVYRRTVVRYLDDNAVHAKMAARSRDYPWCSAYWYAREEGPIWLSRGWVEGQVKEYAGGVETYRAEDYPLRFPPRLSPSIREWVERRLVSPAARADPENLDDLLAAKSPEVRDWMERKALMADGTRPGVPVIPAALLEQALASRDHLFAELRIAKRPRSRSPDAGALARAGLLADPCGLSLREISVRTGWPRSTVHNHVAAHRRALLSDDRYMARCADTAATAFALLRVELEGAGLARPE